jgi:hypothetical protein
MSEAASQGFFRRHWLGTAGVAAGILIPSLWLYLQLVVWKRHGDDLMLTAFGIIVTILLWCLLVAGIVKYWNNAKRDLALEEKANSLAQENQNLRNEITAKDSEFAIRLKEKELELIGDSRLTIHSAFYGVKSKNEKDVTGILRSQGKSAIAIFVSNVTMNGDPVPGIPKFLRVKYSFGNEVIREASEPENGLLVIPRKADTLRTLYFRKMMEECELFLRTYRAISAHSPQESKYPLRSTSWPDVSSPQQWTNTQVSLYCLKTRFDWFVRVMKLAFREAGWPELPEVFAMDNGSGLVLMVDLLPALEKCQTLLKEKVAMLEAQ